MGESETLAMARRSRELKAQGKDIINLSLGEPDFDTPDFVKEAAHQAIEENYSHYTPVAGYPELLEAISVKFQRDNGLHYKPSQIAVSTGAKQAIANVVMSVVNPGDEVIVPAPYWVSYREIIRLAGGIPVVVEAGIEKEFKALAADIEPYITEKTRLFLFSSPNNPSGAVYSPHEIAELAELFGKHPQVVIVSDEIYELICFDTRPPSIGTFAQVADRVVTINGLSKGFAMTGWRLGYLGAPEAIAQACIKFQGQITSATCSITQRAAIRALQATEADVAYMREAFLNRRNRAYEELVKIPGLGVNLPQGAFYFFLKVSGFFGKKFNGNVISNAEELAMYLLNEGEVALVSGTAFGSPEYLRFSYATSEDLILKAIQRIEKALGELN